MLTGWRNALAGLAVLAGLVALVAVPAVFAGPLPDREGPLPADRPVTIVDRVSLRPPAGAHLDAGESRPGAGTVVLLVGQLTVEINSTVLGRVEDPVAYLAFRERKLEEQDDLALSERSAFRTDAGATGVQGSFSSARDDERGCYVVAAAEGVGVTVIVTPVAGCGSVPVEVWSSLRTLTFEPEADR